MDVRGGTLEALLQRDRDSARAVMTRLSEMLAVMHAQRGPAFGKVAHVTGDEVREDRTGVQRADDPAQQRRPAVFLRVRHRRR
ncbi:hypothetical protein ACFVWZ_16115 [Streptomyces sp. NPDC058200]|uniref:hypothetical protein n=1 Tax=Streptomyces sp. NPDC058200 TaxID=3346378 RepID=UPI0036E3A504